jgi:hypothetical protein
MAVINLENIAATASITIQLIKDYSMYESEIISSNGTIFQSTDTDTTLTFRAYKGVEEVTDKMASIEWSKFYFNNDELQEDPYWGTNKRNQKKVVLNKDDIEGKSIIQVSGYAMIDGNRELVTTARITMIKISDIYISDITPVDPSDKMMWMDTNSTPPTLKIWSDDLGYWISSGMDVPIVKNLIRNSNFWDKIEDYYTITNPSYINTPTRTSYINKQWVTLRSKNSNSESGGITQEIQYPIVANSNYIFSFIGYREPSGFDGRYTTVRIISVDNKNRTTDIINTTYELKTNISTIEVPFTTLNDTEKIRIYLGTQRRGYCCFYITELSLYNSSVYYPWELCPEDVDKQINTKLDNNRISVFNTLTDNNKYKAIYESEGQYYIRAEYLVPEVASMTDLNSAMNVINQANSSISVLQNDIKTLQERLSISESKYNALESKHDTLKTSFNSLNSAYEAKVAELTESINNLTKRIEALEANNKTEPPQQ